MEKTSPSLVSSLTAGIAVGLLDIIISISFAALIFAGDLAAFLPQGIGIALVSSGVVCLLLGVISQFRGLISSVQDSGVVILALVAHHIGTTVSDPTTENVFVTIAVFIALSTFVTGLFLLIIGRFKLGNLIRFIPYPVVGGFLGAVGVILFEGAFAIVADVDDRGDLLQADILKLWLPAFLFGIVLWQSPRISRHHLILPILLVVSILVFAGVVAVSGQSLEVVQAAGWMLGPFPESEGWQPIFLEDFSLVEWGFVQDEAWHIISIALVSALALLLNLSGLEVQASDDADINQELQKTGWVNLALAPLGGLVGFHSISLSMLGWRMNGRSRLTGLFFALVFAAVLVFGFSLITYFPKFVLGGLLFFLAIDIFQEWVYDGWYKMPTLEYVVMVAILLIVAFVGYLQGFAFGILAAVTLFAYNTSRTPIVKQTLTGANYHSKVERAPAVQHQLQQVGEQLLVYRLSGLIFFGSANSLTEQALARLSDLRFLLLDFQQVRSVDSSAILALIRLKQMIRRQNRTLVITGLDTNLQQIFARSDFDPTESAHFRQFAMLDEALEWCEDQLLSDYHPADKRETAVLESLPFLFPQSKYQDLLLSKMERLEVPQGTILANFGDVSNALYWVESGRLEARIENDQRQMRVRIATKGAVLGEVALYTDQARTASIIATEPSIVYVMEQATLSALEKDHPEAALHFHRMIVQRLSERLADTTASVQALL